MAVDDQTSLPWQLSRSVIHSVGLVAAEFARNAASGAVDSCAVHSDGHVQIVPICTFTGCGSRIVEAAAQEAVLEDGFSARR